MIYIKETFPDDQSVEILVDGMIDCETIPTLDEVCKRNFKAGKRVLLNLQGIIHISREGKDFLQEIQGGAAIVGYDFL